MKETCRGTHTQILGPTKRVPIILHMLIHLWQNYDTVINILTFLAKVNQHSALLKAFRMDEVWTENTFSICISVL
jgi:hypothetical protein